MKTIGIWGKLFRGVIWCCAFGMVYLEVLTVVEYLSSAAKDELGRAEKELGSFMLMMFLILPALAVSFASALFGVVRPALALAVATLIAVIMFVTGLYLAGPITFMG